MSGREASDPAAPREDRRRAAIHTLGCRLNQSESGILVDLLRREGYEIVPFGESADLGVVHTCTVTREADAKSRRLIRSFIRANPRAYVAVLGCYAQTGHQALAAIEGIDLICGNQEKMNLLEFVRQGKNPTPLIIRDHLQRADFTLEFAGDAPTERRANLKIQDGCNFMCSFCVIPFARGRSRSREMGNLLDEARALIARGAKELVLTGVNLGCYTCEGLTIVDVVNNLNGLPGLARIRISSIEPTTVPGELLDCMAEPAHALAPYLHLPLQSGSDAVLRRMKRRYTRREFVEFVETACRRVPDLCVGTDILVGMPGESDAEFEETCAVLRDAPIAYAHVFKYSERDGTASQRMPDKVDPKTANRRSARIRRISAAKRQAFYERYLGASVEVLFEQQQDGWWEGYTGNYVRVAARSSKRLRNEFGRVRVESIRGDIAIGALND
ncbi:MAG TPA: tRNA (N(6)-L-threonylcarbamoyladenosine(37)-C(2))-methylthiotransferase MtaB [Candidatus Hydrogenedentes bacterium]|jgi:threonylcarbamoyladenosine tRNA methylthiotransferase MtaB|nr:tRNA (N(6)-L-threonylcarbamoyladenosine(37)-C(2))-methylthiotransferase MtaB [FCB group bacterium]NLT60118.1 tRNA (N(6)-L-threonylcarbamoyladenosine(37)-C(2))-methylthiotransferase MtaB [Candidatus Hydrogenedentota bacterium]HNV21897.1 tRNA (N(6)-L-threonylcarbamoyladenosine(37)-C(2))-methylthiotransferase MtaB [Candidatus Hydrogenedentota bacterium]HNZ19814.1 tRNA (N(6)-L-threonylcarbamoyladenosine(37)-C(2))-methylthiotransferase MtaB [Candidatus Hydrogenedentota bacterium]HOH35305.1 tRNA (